MGEAADPAFDECDLSSCCTLLALAADRDEIDWLAEYFLDTLPRLYRTRDAVECVLVAMGLS